MQPYGLHVTLFLFTRILFFRPRQNIPIFLPILLHLFGKKKKKKLIMITSRCLSNFMGSIVWYFSAALSCEQRPFFLVTVFFFKNIVVLRDREEWSPETWAKACKNEQHIGSIKDLRPQKISNQLTFKPQMTANQYAAKRRIYKRPDQQKYTLSRHTEFCKADRTTWNLTLRDEPQKAVYGYDPALFLVLSVSCWCLAKLIFT